MESAPRRDHVSTWSDSADPDLEHSDVLVAEPAPETDEPAVVSHPAEAGDAPAAIGGRNFDDDVYLADQVATEYAVAPGMPGRGVIMVSLVASLAAALVDFGLTGGLTIFFDLCFVTVCLVGAMAVRRADLFTTGVLAPLVFGAVIAVVSVLAPATFAASGGISRVFLTGLAVHAGALVSGYAVALATVWGRVAAARG